MLTLRSALTAIAFPFSLEMCVVVCIGQIVNLLLTATTGTFKTLWAHLKP